MIRATLNAALLGLLPALAAAQEAGPLRIQITEGISEPTAIAIAPFGGPQPLADRLRQVVIDDLTGTDLFRAIPDDALIGGTPGVGAAVRWSGWRAVNAQALVVAEVAQQGGDDAPVSLRFRLYDVMLGAPLGDGIEFSAAPADWRRLAHKLADQVYLRLTGEGAYFDSRVAFVHELGPRTTAPKGWA